MYSPECVPCVFTSLCSPPLQLWWKQSWCHRRCCCCCVLPATAAVSAKINARSVTVLCCNALDSSFLSLIHSLPLSTLLPPCFLSPSLTCAQSHVRRHCGSQNTNRLSSLKTWLCSLNLMIFFFFLFKARTWRWMEQMCRSLTYCLWSAG